MKKQKIPEPYNDVKIEGGMNAVLDSVLEDIDTILIDNIPNANRAFPPLPIHRNEIPKDESQSQPSPYQYEDVVNNNEMQSNNNNNMVINQSNNNLNHQNMYPNNTLIQQRIVNIQNNYTNYNNYNNNKSFITPSSSYNSLASLDTVKSSTSNDEMTSKDTQNKILFESDCGQIKIASFSYNICSKLQIKNFVFISKDCTQRLSEYIVREEWGSDQGLLYKYIDYIFRSQSFKEEIIIVNNKYLIFHSGLQRRSDKQFLYALLVRNKKYVAQKWRVQFGNIKNSFLSKYELLSKLAKSYLIEDYLPKRTKFYNCLSDLLYDESYSIEVNWEERLTTNKDRIQRVLGNIAFFDSKSKFMKLSELISSFKCALNRSKQIASLNPRLAVGQAFIDKKKCVFRCELLLPLIIEFPKHSSNYYCFALAMHKSMDKKYVVKSILTMEMAYSNARLVGYVDSNWLFYGKYNNNNKPKDINDFFL